MAQMRPELLGVKLSPAADRASRSLDPAATFAVCTATGDQLARPLSGPSSTSAPTHTWLPTARAAPTRPRARTPTDRAPPRNRPVRVRCDTSQVALAATPTTLCTP